jgi:Double-GTPase 1
MMPERNFTVIGPANSGKTTYFAALYYLLKNADEQYSFHLDRQSQVQDRSYLNEISEAWANLQPIKHTQHDHWETLQLPLVSSDKSQRFTLYIPDLAGEFFGSTLNSRSWDEKISLQITRSEGFLLFINVGDYRPVELMDEDWAARIEEQNAALIKEQNVITAKELNKDDQKAEVSKPTLWEPDPEKLPSDVFYTDLIQQVHFQNTEKHYRVSIVLSAWDTVRRPADYNNPKSYFEKRFPLLTQFFASHEDRYQIAFFGVSAYGTDPSKPDAVKALEDREPFERVIVVGPDGVGHNITLPLMHLSDYV